MLRSMTGYGRAEAQTEAWQLVVEVSTVNHRFLDVSVRLPRPYMALEHRIRRLVGKRFSRGRFELACSISPTEGRRRQLVADEALVAEAVRLLKELQATHGLSGSVDLLSLMQVRDLLRVEEASEDVEELWQALEPVVAQALEDLEAMRAEEGQALGQDICRRASQIEKIIAQLTQRLPEARALAHQALKKRLEALLADVPVDEQRLAQEAALLADRSDVSEEITRLESHLKQMEELLEHPEPVGRKLEFLLQEMHREANTIGSKASDAEVSRLVVELKHELEKIREQVQNIE